MWLAALVLVLSEPKAELWAGNQVLTGEHSLGILGSVKTRSDSYVLAHVEYTAEGVRLTQWACDVVMAKAGGTDTALNSGVAPRLPVTRIEFLNQPDGSLLAKPWTSGWDATDHDGDGLPGVTINVDAAMCDGKLFIASTAYSEAHANSVARGMQGDVTVRVSQKILGASNMCLGIAASDSQDQLAGRFAYVPVPSSTTCASFAPADWPVRASPP
ncbi:MAG: hypothetical protein H7Z43_13335 [Clostridia bacterium]|nr:hypothetical protein [Deltaproteobacteria bacterium]